MTATPSPGFLLITLNSFVTLLAPNHNGTVEPSLIDTHETGHRLSITHLDVQTPDGHKTLLKSLDLNLKPGTSILLMGPSGTGKSSLLRTIAGLWNTGGGSITRSPPSPA